MYHQQAYPSFTPNHGIIQDGFESYHHPSQGFFSPAVRTDSGVLGEHQAQVMAWNHATQLEPSSHLNFCAPPSHQLNMETPCMEESRKIEESEDSDGLVEKSHLIPQDYPYDWIPDFWPESPNFSSQTQQNTSVPGSEVYLTPPNQRPNTPVETVVADLESSHCSSTPNQEVAESNSPAGWTVNSLGAQEKILSEDMLKMPSEMEMARFARDLKWKRVNMGYTQADVSYAVGILYGKMFNQATIGMFESAQLSYNDMFQIKPYLHSWLEDAKKNRHHLQKLLFLGHSPLNSARKVHNYDSQAPTFHQPLDQPNPLIFPSYQMTNSEHAPEQALGPFQKRRRRTGLSPFMKSSLETYFRNNPKPATLELEQIAQDLNLEKEMVRKWFSSRCQKKSLLVKELSNKGSEPQHKVPHVVEVFSNQEIPFPGDMSGSPPM